MIRRSDSLETAQDYVDFLILPQWKTVTVKEATWAYQVEALPLSEPSACPRCGAPAAKLRPCGSRRRAVKDSPVRGKRVCINFARRLYRCQECRRVSQQPLFGIDTRRRATSRLIKLIEAETFRKTNCLVSEETGTSTSMVRAIFVEKVLAFEQSRHPEAPRILGLDEAYIRGRGRLLLTDLAARRPLEILARTDMLALCRYLLQMSRREEVEAVVMDLRRSYFEVVRRVLPQAAVVIDKWAVLRLAQQPPLTVLRKVRSGLPAGHYLRLARAGKYLNKSRSKLSQGEKETLEKLFRQMPELGEAYRLRREFFSVWRFRSRQKAEERYEQWMTNVPSSLYYAFGDLLRIVGDWHQEVFNYFDHPVSNAFTESIIYRLRVLHTISPTCSFETLRAKVIYERFAKRPRNPKPEGDTSLLARKASRVRPKARRAPAPRIPLSGDERLRRVRKSKTESADIPRQINERLERLLPPSREKQE